MFKKSSGLLMVVGQMLLFLLLFTPTPVAAITIPETRCVYAKDCEAAPSTPSYTPSYTPGPTPEEQRQQREAKDLNEASQDADDKGVEAYERGNYADAVRHFREGLEFAPDDSDIKHKLQMAQQRLRDSEVARQLKTIEHHSTTAAPLENEPASGEARRGFDTAGKPAGTLASPAVYAGAGGGGDPIVPKSKRTPRITALEHERDDVKKNIAALEAERKTLDPKTDVVKVSVILQKESQAKQKVHILNLSISTDLENPSPTTGNTPVGAKSAQ